MSNRPAPAASSATIDRALSLNAIAQREPRALEVFARYGLDACCGGAKSLETACERHQVPIDELLNELTALLAR